MATSGSLGFGKFIDDWVRKTDRRMLAVARESTQRLVSLCQSRIPIDTGFARASIQGSLSEMPSIDPASRGRKDQTYAEPQEVYTVIAGAELGDIIYVGWTASYVGFLENGHSKQAPAGFVRVSVLEWPQIVSQVVAEAKSR